MDQHRRNFQLSLMVWDWRWAYAGNRVNRDKTVVAIQWQLLCRHIVSFFMIDVLSYK